MRSGRPCSIIESDKATGDKDPCDRDGSYADVAACRRLVLHVRHAVETSAGTAGLEKPDLEKAKALLKESGTADDTGRRPRPVSLSDRVGARRGKSESPHRP